MGIIMTKLYPLSLCGVAVGMLLGAHVAAQPPRAAPADWPCVQSYVPSVSAGRFWQGELPRAERWRDDARVVGLADELLKRTLGLNESLDRVREFFALPENATRATGEALIGALTAGVNRERAKVLDAVVRFGGRQRVLAERIESQAQGIAQGLEELQNTGGDEAELEDLQTRQRWDIRVFEERERMADHLCEQPVLLEQKFFAIGRVVASLFAPDG